MLFSKLFQGKEEIPPEEQLTACRQKKDWAGLAKAYFRMGSAAMDRGDQTRAVLWLHRADTIYSARDEVYEQVGDKVTDGCSDRIGVLEEAPLLYNTIPVQVEEKAEELTDVQARMWGLLSLARLVRLGEQLGRLPGCQALGRLGWAVDTVFRSLQKPPSQEEFSELQDLSGAFYELGDDPAFWGAESQLVPAQGAPFQVFDLNGQGVLLELDAFLDGHLKMVLALSQGEEPPAPETGLIGCTLLLDYYARTGEGSLDEVPQIRAELERIWHDYDFVRTRLSWEGAAARLEEYRALDLLG